MDQLAYICFLSHDGKSCGTLWPRCLFIVGQSIILGNFFQNSIVDCIADFSFINMTMWSRAVLWWQRWVTMSSFFYQFGKMNIWNPSVSCYNGVMVWCNCYGVIKTAGFCWGWQRYAHYLQSHTVPLHSLFLVHAANLQLPWHYSLYPTYYTLLYWEGCILIIHPSHFVN